MSDAPLSPTLKELPKVSPDLKSELQDFNTEKLKNAETNEKNVLPTAEAIELEKGQQQLIAGIENFDAKSLKPTETQEKNPLPTKEVIEAEKSA